MPWVLRDLPRATDGSHQPPGQMAVDGGRGGGTSKVCLFGWFFGTFGQGFSSTLRSPVWCFVCHVFV